MGDNLDTGGQVEQAFREHHDRVYRYLLRRSGNHVDAEELTQRVFTDAAAALARTRPNSVLAWLYAVAERRFVDEVRRRTRRREVPLFDDAELASENTYGPGVAGALSAAIRKLPADQRQVVVMRLLEDRPFDEIADRLGTTEAACKMRLSRGLSTLRDLLREEGLEP